MNNALVVLQQHLTQATAGTDVAVAHAKLEAEIKMLLARAASPFQEHEDVLHGIKNSGFKPSQVNPADVKLVESLSADPEKIAQLVANLFRIVRDRQVGVAINYSLFMSTWMAVIASLLHWERKNEDEKDAKSTPWAKQLLYVTRSVMNQFTELDITEKLKAFDGSPLHDAMVSVWRKIAQFLKRVWAFVKSVLRRGSAAMHDTEIDVPKLLGTCVSAMRTFAVLSKNVEGIEFDAGRVPGLPRVHTQVEPA